MSDEMDQDAQPQVEPEATSEAASAWREVVSELDALGAAIGRWVNAAANDPDNKRRLEDLSARLDGFADSVGASVKGAAEGEVGQSFKEAADKTGEAFKVAGDKLSEEVGPKLAGAFKSMSEKLRGAAEKLEERQPEAAAPAEAASADTPDTPAGHSA